MKTFEGSTVVNELAAFDKALAKFSSVDNMEEWSLQDEFWKLQNEFDNMTESQAETFLSQVKLARQHLLANKWTELTGNSFC